jgi:Mrp family chromosome partitioning ATPase
MSDIDVYDFKGTLKEYEDDSFLDFTDNKAVAVIEVGKTNKEIDKKLIEMGYEIGDRVLVVVQ